MSKKVKEEHKEAEEPKKRTAEHDKHAEELKAQLLRALADFDNFRKRTAAEKDELGKYANERFARELLPVLDGLAKASEFASKSDSENLVKGLALVIKQMKDALSKFGVEEIVSLGKKFDPNFHEAILMKESGSEPGTVIEEAQKGYTIHGRLLRPSMVIVSKAKEEGK